MIDYLTKQNDNVAYAVIGFIAFACFTLGYMFGFQPAESVCAEYIIDLDQKQKELLELNKKLTECEAKGAGKAVLDCSSICDKRVSEAIQNYKEVVCDD